MDQVLCLGYPGLLPATIDRLTLLEIDLLWEGLYKKKQAEEGKSQVNQAELARYARWRASLSWAERLQASMEGRD